MATLFILLLLLLSIFLALFQRTRACNTLLLSAALWFLVASNGWFASLLLAPLQTAFVDVPSPSWKKHNAIVLLGAGTVKLPIVNTVDPTALSYSRINKAAQLYFACMKSHNHGCTVVISGGDAFHTGKPEAVVYQEALLKLQVRQADIKLEANSMNTYQNAKFTRNILKRNHFDQIILVTSGIQLRRALLYFSFFGIHAKPALADYFSPPSNTVPLGYNLALDDFAIHEYIGIARFYFYNFMGWNKI